MREILLGASLMIFFFVASQLLEDRHTKTFTPSCACTVKKCCQASEHPWGEIWWRSEEAKSGVVKHYQRQAVKMIASFLSPVSALDSTWCKLNFGFCFFFTSAIEDKKNKAMKPTYQYCYLCLLSVFLGFNV